MARPLKEIDEQLMLKKYLSGLSSRELAKEFGVTKQTVLNRMHKYVDIDFNLKRSVIKTLK